jgi:hypothetical protein
VVRNRGSNPPFKGSTSRDASSSAASIVSLISRSP